MRASAHYLSRSLLYYATCPLPKPHPLNCFRAFDISLHNEYNHTYDVELVAGKQIIMAMLSMWTSPITEFDGRSIAWSLSKFSPLVIEDVAAHLVSIQFCQPREREQAIVKPSATLPADIILRLETSLASLEQALLDKDPMMPQHLRASHQLLISYPETVHLLDDAEIARLISAAQIHTNVEILKAAVPKTGGRKKASADDL